MKSIQTILLLTLALANGSLAVAQSNLVPGDTDYARFSQFIANRNIFDPNRYPHETHSYRPLPRTRPDSAPAFTLVGTMTYEKGMFAFFSGNSSDLKKILTVNGSIAGYAVTEITLNGATLQGADKKEIKLKIGDQMREENNAWQLAEQGDAPAGSGGADSSTTAGGGADSNPAAASSVAAPSASLGNNDVLKRLMQQREQETK